MKLNDLQQPVALASRLAPQAITVDVLKEKYCRTGETSAQEVRRRVARALAMAEAPDGGYVGSCG